jgi:hypothetical protein
MTIVLILLPYAIFTVLMLVVSPALSLTAGAALCLAVVIMDVARGRSIKLLTAGSAAVFVALACYCGMVDPGMTATAIRIAIDGGILVIALGSMLAGVPFTLQYAMESVPAETAAMPGFLQANYVISGVWATAMALMMAANIMMIFVPELPIWAGLAIAFAARNSALYFTRWYPDYRIKREIRPAGALAVK